MGYIFDNREMAEGEKLDTRKVSKYQENFTLAFDRQIEYRFCGPHNQRLYLITLLAPVRGSEAPFLERQKGWRTCCRQGKIPQTATKFPQNAR